MIEITDAAFERAARKTEETSHEGIRIALRSGGCAGFEYTFDYCDSSTDSDFTLDFKKFKIFIDNLSASYLVGATLDFIKQGLQEEFVLINPNEVTKCGCGVSATF